MLRLESVEVYLGQSHILKGVTLYVQTGEMVALVGSNGAGKSTLMGALAGLYPVRRGRIIFLGEDIANRRPNRIVRLGMSLVPERREIFDSLTVRDNLILGSYHHYYKDRKNALQRLVEVFDIFPSLKERANTLAGALSGGEQQMLAIGRGLMSKPRLLLLDEPSIGLAPLVVQEIFRVLGALKRLGATVLLVEQNARLALANSDRAYVLERGAITLAGNSAELLADQSVQAAYLGKRHSATSAPRHTSPHIAIDRSN